MTLTPEADAQNTDAQNTYEENSHREPRATLEWVAGDAAHFEENDQGGYGGSGEGQHLRVTLHGDWTALGLAAAEERLERLAGTSWRSATINLAGASAFDTAGAWAVHRLCQALAQAGTEVTLTGVDTAKDSLLTLVSGVALPPKGPKRLRPPLNLLALLGENAVESVKVGRDLLGFLGLAVVSLAGGLLHPSRLRWTASVNQMEKVGMNAIPIVGLLSFLIGVVLAYQGAEQLAYFGAEIFVANLVGVAILREMGVLITSIVIAGRSGSAFAAQIGTMKVNQEVDAMRTIGLDPMQELVLPRIIAMGLMLPLLTFFANLMGLLGGAVMAMAVLDIHLIQFIGQLNDALTVQTFLIGMVKAPVFAFIIGVVGCFEGMQVGGNAESVGTHTTRAVVEAIFLVIVLDALFSVLFSVLGV